MTAREWLRRRATWAFWFPNAFLVAMPVLIVIGILVDRSHAAAATWFPAAAFLAALASAFLGVVLPWVLPSRLVRCPFCDSRLDRLHHLWSVVRIEKSRIAFCTCCGADLKRPVPERS